MVRAKNVMNIPGMTHLSPDNKDDTGPPKAADPVKVEPVQGRERFPQESNYDRLASDKIGEELNPKGSIWKLYSEEAREYDTKVNQDQNGNLNNMLLFATLFSAIVTAFIIESTNLLEQDSSEVSTQLLLALVQSQRRIEIGTPDSTSSPVEMPEFVPSGTARLINVLWFASLMISLATAVVAILAKEWLAAFISYQTRDAHKYALERQARLASLDAWNMVPIIDLLPTFLYLALFLFCLGLHVRLWLLDFIVAAAVSCISAMLGLVYLFFMISGAVRQDCPYKALLTIYFRRMVQRIVKYFNRGRSTPPDAQKNTEPADTQKKIQSAEIELLTWLFHRSTDPILGNYVPQALAGLRSLNLGLPTFLEKHRQIQELGGIYTENSKILASVFGLGSQAMDQLRMAPTRGRNELESCGGSSAARLAIAMSEIYPYALTWRFFHKGIQRLEDTTAEENVQNNSRMRRQVAHNNAPAIDMPSVCKITDNVFDALDLVWAETSPPLKLSAYAYLLTAELKMARHALAFLGSREQESPVILSHASIEMTASFNAHYELPGLTLGGLWVRSNLALVRTALVIKASVNHVTSKGSQELQSAIFALLSEATKLVEQEKPSLDDTLDLPGVFNILHGQDVSVTIVTESNRTQRLTCGPQALGYELVEGLVKLCDSGSEDTLLVEGFRVAAFNLLLTFWPAYIQSRRRYGYIIPPWVIQPWEIVPPQTTPCNSKVSAEIIAYEFIVLVYLAIGLGACEVLDEVFWEREKWSNILRLILRLLLSMSNILSNKPYKPRIYPRNAKDPEPSCLYYKWLPPNSTLVNWIRSIHNQCHFPGPGKETLHMSSWCTGRLIDTVYTLTFLFCSEVEMDLYAHLGSTHLARGRITTVEHFGLQVDQLLEFIYAASQMTGRDVTTTGIAKLLRQVTSFIETTKCHDCLQYFAQGHGFDILLKIGRTESDRTVAAATVHSVLVALQAAQLLVDPSVLPLLCEAMCYICDYDRVVLDDRDLFVSSARLQLQQLPKVIDPTTFFAIQKLIGRLTCWAERIEYQFRFIPDPESKRSNAGKIASLRDQVQQWVEPDSFCDSAPSPASDQARGILATSNTRSSLGEAPGDNGPDDASNRAGSSGRTHRNPLAEVTISSEPQTKGLLP